jgi:hypothetical protein
VDLAATDARIDYASWCVDIARLVGLGAIDARVDADELACATRS